MGHSHTNTPPLPPEEHVDFSSTADNVIAPSDENKRKTYIEKVRGSIENDEKLKRLFKNEIVLKYL